MIMFWGNLTKEQADQYIIIRKELRLYESWNSLKPKEKILHPEVFPPSDNNLIILEQLSMIGWNMI